MSGIAGIVRFDGGGVEPGQIEKMTAAMSYRGPDGINHRVLGSVALGHCLFRTTSESLEETQPLANEDESLTLVMDGWLSNWEELRAELVAKSARLRTRADAELVLRAYEAWGADCVAHIEGDFAFVIWDARRCEAFCARDRMGNKPLFYCWNDDQLIFASELTPVLEHPSTPETPNLGKIAEFLASQWYTRDETSVDRNFSAGRGAQNERDGPRTEDRALLVSRSRRGATLQEGRRLFRALPGAVRRLRPASLAFAESGRLRSERGARFLGGILHGGKASL